MRKSWLCLSIAAFVVTMGASSAARGADVLASEGAPPPSPFERPFALGANAVGWAGGYTAGGVGGRVRWEFLPRALGIDLVSEHLIVDWPGGLRHDHPFGFNVYVPIALSKGVRVRPLLGFCTVLSFVEPKHAGAPRADDILVGAHGGAGIEIAVDERVSWFLDAQAIVYLAHDRTTRDWTGQVASNVGPIAVFQPATGLQLHL